MWQMMTFLDPLGALISKIPFSFFPGFWVWVTFEAWGSDSVGFWGSCQLSPFWGRGGSGRRALSTPPPPETKTRLPLRSQFVIEGCCVGRLQCNCLGALVHVDWQQKKRSILVFIRHH